MSANSKIEWTDHTFNPWIGCTKVSPGCANCYAESEDKRRGWTADGWGKGKPRKRTSEGYWARPLVWNKLHGFRGSNERQRVFCASLADWLDDEVPIEWLADLLALIHATPNLDWLLLTKRPENFVDRMVQATNCWADRGNEELTLWVMDWYHGDSPPNVWIGTSVEDQKRADERIPLLLKIPATIRFLSCEPLLGPIDLNHVRERLGEHSFQVTSAIDHSGYNQHGEIDWVIVGGESGHGARPMHPHWARSLRDQCVAAGVPFFFKQWGEWMPRPIGTGSICINSRGGKCNYHDPGAESMSRVGKRTAGRLLDGREWSEFPKSALGNLQSAMAS